MALKLDPQAEGGMPRAIWRALWRAIELPGGHSLPDVLRRARAASGRADPESQWALRQYEALRQTLENEKQTLSRIFATSLLSFVGLAALGDRWSGGGRWRLLAPLTGALTLGVGLRIWMVNALLRRFWERAAED